MKHCKFKITGLSSQAVKRVISIDVTDSQGEHADTVTIKLDDRDYRLQFPELGLEMKVFLGYKTDKKTKLVDMGLFELQKITHTETAKGGCYITLKATSFFYLKNTFKDPKSGKFEDKTLKEIFGIIANRNGYKLDIDPSIGSIYENHISQSRESDINLITRICDQYNAFAKVANKTIFIYPKSKSTGNIIITKKREMQTSISGLVLTLASSLTWEKNKRTQYDGVEISFQNTDDKKIEKVLVGGKKNVYEDKRTFTSRKKAREVAAAKLATLNRNGLIKDLKTIGDGNIKAGMDGILIGFKPGINNRFHIKEVKSTMNDRGFVTSITGDQEN